MTEHTTTDAVFTNDSQWLKKECLLAHVAFAILLVLGSFAGWIGAEAISVDRAQGVLLGLGLPVGIYFIYSPIYGFRVWMSMESRIAQLTQTTNAILAGQNEGFTSLAGRIHAETKAPGVEAEATAEQEQALVEKIERENADWLYDSKGNTTREAELVRKHIEEAKRLGIKGAQARWDYATAMVERDLLKEWMDKHDKPAGSDQPLFDTRNAPPPLL